MKTISVRIGDEVAARLEQISERTGASTSDIIRRLVMAESDPAAEIKNLSRSVERLLDFGREQEEKRHPKQEELRPEFVSQTMIALNALASGLIASSEEIYQPFVRKSRAKAFVIPREPKENNGGVP